MEKYKKEELEKLIIKEKMSYCAIGRLYGVSDAAIKKAAKKFGIVLPQKRKINPCETFSGHKGFRKDSLVNQKTNEEFISIVNISKNWKELAKRLGYKNGASINIKLSIQERSHKLGIEIAFERSEEVLSKTKKELFENRKNWQSARTAIQKNARKIYREKYPHPICAICGYDKQVEVAHKKAVSEFDDNATVKEINSIDNLVGLCPNHHWEYDHGFLKL